MWFERRFIGGMITGGLLALAGAAYLRRRGFGKDSFGQARRAGHRVTGWLRK